MYRSTCSSSDSDEEDALFKWLRIATLYLTVCGGYWAVTHALRRQPQPTGSAAGGARVRQALTKSVDDKILAKQQQSVVGANIVNIHKDTRSGGDTDDTVIRVVVVTVVNSSDISGESVRDL